MTSRSHLFPSRTQKLRSIVPKILGWRRPGKIGRCRPFSFSWAKALRICGRTCSAKAHKRFSVRPLGQAAKTAPSHGAIVGSIPAGVTKTGLRQTPQPPYAPLAQLVEQLTLNQRAQGSSPWKCTTKAGLLAGFSFSRYKNLLCPLKLWAERNLPCNQNILPMAPCA